MIWLQSFWGPEVAHFGPLGGALSIDLEVPFRLKLGRASTLTMLSSRFRRFRIADLFPKILLYDPLCSLFIIVIIILIVSEDYRVIRPPHSIFLLAIYNFMFCFDLTTFKEVVLLIRTPKFKRNLYFNKNIRELLDKFHA